MQIQDNPPTPSLQAIRQHLARLITGDGLLEIASDDSRGNLNRAKLFVSTEIDDAARYAAAENTAKRNVFVGAATRRPDAPRDRRASDKDFAAAAAVTVDIDDRDAAEQALNGDVPLLPSFFVVTHTEPNYGCHLYFLLDHPLTDPAKLVKINRAIAAAVGADMASTNASRVLRLAGCIAWPRKPGRIPELVTLERRGQRVGGKHEPPIYSIKQLEEAFLSILRPDLPINEATPAEEWIDLIRSGAKEGERNHASTRLAGLLIRHLDPRIALELVLAWNRDRNQPPLDDSEIEAVVDSICKRELQKRA